MENFKPGSGIWKSPLKQQGEREIFYEDAADLVYLAEARLVMGKILVNQGTSQDALPYLDHAKAAFECCHHYAFGETLLYLGRAYQGLSDSLRAKEYLTAALAEFHRLELHHKARETQEALDAL